LAFSGCGLAEAGYVKWTDVDLEGGMMWITETRFWRSQNVKKQLTQLALSLGYLHRRVDKSGGPANLEFMIIPWPKDELFLPGKTSYAEFENNI
jgi:hypothetical protein